MTRARRSGWSRAGLATAVLVLLGGPPGLVMLRARGVPGPPSTAPLQLPVFRTGIDMVSLTVTVSDPAGRYVTDLSADEFHVFEDGRAQNVAFFNKTNVPIALALLLDTSASMTDRLTTAQDAAVGFAHRLRPLDVGELIGFDRDVRVVQPFTGDPAVLERAIRSTTAAGSTSLYNALYISLKELSRNRATTEQDLRRQAIVVLSDGADTSSLVGYDEVLELARRSETAIYTIGLRSKDEIADKAFKEPDFVLRQLAQETGGRVFFPARIEDLAGVYSQIADELASQYVLGYISKNPTRDGAWRRVTVRVDRQGATARTRQGYFGPSAKQAPTPSL
jgi:Ca-activated chloride channel homolog